MRLGRPCLIAALCLAAPGAGAAPLTPAECKTLKSEHESLLAAGAKTDMAKGPDWAKKNLTADRLDKIARLITVEEKLSFRCGQLVTAAPRMKELPQDQTATSRPGGKGLSRIPLPVRKSEAAARKDAKKK